jgi:hypothetical protein
MLSREEDTSVIENNKYNTVATDERTKSGNHLQNIEKGWANIL